MQAKISTVTAETYPDQKPGTSGLREKVKQFSSGTYLENFIQSIFDAMPPDKRGALVVGGDGRYFNKPAAQKIIKMAVANGFERIVTGRGALLSTPAVSNLIRTRGAIGGIVLTASHNPGGPEHDFGVKFNNSNGSPAPESVTQEIYRNTLNIKQFRVCNTPDIDLGKVGVSKLGNTIVEVVDPVSDYRRRMEDCFDFDRLRDGFGNGRLSVCFDGMHAVTGPYARRILEECLGAPEGSVINSDPLEDFGGGHPDPNQVHAHQLVEIMSQEDAPALGAASDGDGDRNLILGRNFFVTPSDSLAILTAHAEQIPQFAGGLKGVARSMPTSGAVDRVASALGIDCFETPTGWKFFGNLLDAGRINLCGEESFGTGGDHVREKDGLWTVLCWLSLLEKTGLSVEQLVRDHWRQYGRHIYCRYDYEGIDSQQAEQLMEALQQSLPGLPGLQMNGFNVTHAARFRYEDPVDGSASETQGVQVFLEPDSRIVFRLSGTGTSGATLRVYLEQYRADHYDVDAIEENFALSEVAAQIAAIERHTGLTQPTVET